MSPLWTGAAATLAESITIHFVLLTPSYMEHGSQKGNCLLAGGKSFQWCYFSVCSDKYKEAFLFHKELLSLFESMLLPKQTPLLLVSEQSILFHREVIFCRRLVGNLENIERIKVISEQTTWKLCFLNQDLSFPQDGH